MSDARDHAAGSHPLASGSSRAATAVLLARQTLQCRRGLPLAAVGFLVLLSGLLRASEMDWLLSLGILVGATSLAVALVTYQRRRERMDGSWARPAGEPSLASPFDKPTDEPRMTAWVQLGALLLAAAVAGVAVFSGVALDALIFWVIAYGIVHMAMYCLALCVSLQLSEQILSALWFMAGGLYWLRTGNAIALVLGGGWGVTGLLLYLRLRRITNAVPPLSAADPSEVSP